MQENYSTEIDQLNYKKRFSICSLVTDETEYAQMLESFKEAGFNNENSEFIYANNSDGNKYDGYSGVSQFLHKACGKYIIICHQDILLKFDNIDILNKRIEEMDKLDPSWAILANAGYKNFNDVALRISDPHGSNRNFTPFPAKVKSVDENFIVIKKSANLTVSNDINGFHLYGTDLCLFASMIGYSSYVIDFHLYHKSAGTCGTNFYEVKKQLIKSYEKKLKLKILRTPCTMLTLTSSNILNNLLNKKIVYSMKKRYDKLMKKLG